MGRLLDFLEVLVGFSGLFMEFCGIFLLHIYGNYDKIDTMVILGCYAIFRHIFTRLWQLFL
jgi:hypothetical protein